jgi:hypothetical protein
VKQSRFAAAVLAAVLGLAGCGGGDTTETEPAVTPTPTEDATPEPTEAPTEVPTDEATEEPTEDATEEAGGGAVAIDGDVTQPNTELAIGETAIVPFQSADDTGLLGVTVTGIDRGDPADLEELGLGDQIAGLTPFYIRVTISNESGSDFAFSSVGLMNGILGDGSRAQSVSVIGQFDPCPNSSAGPDFTTVGATYERCLIALAGGSAEVVGAEYAASAYEGIEDAPNYILDPITWR